MDTQAHAGAGRPSLLLVHGAWHGAWCWEPLRAALGADGRRSHAVDLPSAGSADRDRRAGMRDDADAIREALRGIDGPVVVVAHSYGGVPATEAVAGAGNAVGVVYVAGFPLDVGDSMAAFLGTPVPDDGTGLAPPYEDSRRILFADVPEADARRAVARLRPHSVRSFTEPVTAAGWRTLPSHYVVCEHDQALEPARQHELARRADVVHRLPSGHSPFLSMPRRLAALLGRIADAALPAPSPGGT
ncbi:alpha/beta fold hydrolase [Streptomyces sp. ODS05-4]|uniref:alpha/beta fold hydrolase n=1 Tax=Streptomyces sp. ODS05-4 TaxID=2944939 RepID=UPI002108AC1F|nr:alpha/beta fold hydrolase [Streptomyces sp. ODS05-4]